MEKAFLKNSLLASTHAGIGQSFLDADSQRRLEVCHDLFGPESSELGRKPAEDFGVQRKLSARHNDGEDADDGSFVISENVHDLRGPNVENTDASWDQTKRAVDHCVEAVL